MQISNQPPPLLPSSPSSAHYGAAMMQFRELVSAIYRRRRQLNATFQHAYNSCNELNFENEFIHSNI